MTNKEIVDNIMFAAAIQQLTVHAAKTGMSDKEVDLVKKDLERKLRPTIMVA